MEAGAPGDRLRVAARAVLARDGVDYRLQPWQVAYLVAVGDGRPGEVPIACGAGRGWLQARLDEAMAGAEAMGPHPGASVPTPPRDGGAGS